MKRIILILVFSFIVYPNVHSDVLSTLSYQGGYSGNLFNDSLAYDDMFHSVGGAVQVYPSNSIELQASGYYTAYSDITDLSNIYGNVSLTAIQDSYDSDFSFLAGGNFYFQKYGQEFEIYDYYTLNLNANGLYRAVDNFSASLGGYISNTMYTYEESLTIEELGLYGGFNWTFLGRNTIDLEMQLYRKRFKNLLDARIFTINADYDFIDYNVSYARPISEAIGLNLSFLHRELSYDTRLSLTGYSIDYLSPWSSLWEGDQASASLKMIFRKEIVMRLYGEYAEKEYIPILEINPRTDEYYRVFREDEKFVVGMSLAKKIYFTNTILTPTLDVSYTYNSSNSELYEYDKLLVMLSLTYGF